MTLFIRRISFDLEEVYNQCPDAREIIGSNGTERRLTTPIFKQLTLFCVNQTEQNSYKIPGLIDNKRCYRWIDKRYIETHPNLEKYKVIVPKSNGSGVIGEVLSTPLIGEPLIGVTQSFLTIGAFDTQAEAESCLKYVKTSLFVQCWVFSRLLRTIPKTLGDLSPCKTSLPRRI